MPARPTSETGTAAAETDIQLATLWRSVRRSAWSLCIATIVAGTLTFGALSLMASRYTSEAQLSVTAKRSNPFPDAGDRPADSLTTRLDKEAINTHVRALLAPDLLLKVADELRLRNRREFNETLGPLDTWGSIQRLVGLGGPRIGESEEDRVLGVVIRQLEVSAAKESRFIAIKFTSSEPPLSAAFANRLGEAYKASLIAVPVEETSQVVRLLTPKVEQLRREVLEAEASVERYRAATGQFKSGSQSIPVNDQRMSGLNDELIKAEAARSEAEARWRTAVELMRSGSAEVLPDVQKSPLIQGLINQRVRLDRQIAEAGASLLPGHPRMRQLQADLAGLKRQIVVEVQKLVQSLEKDYSSSRLRVESVTRQLDALKSKVVGQSGDEARLKELQSTAAAKRAELERLQKQLEDNRTVVNIRQVPVEAQIISRARPSSVPAYPRKGPTTLLAMAATMILGLAFAITRGLLSAPVAGLAVPPAGQMIASKPAQPLPVPPLLREPVAAGGRKSRPQPAALDHRGESTVLAALANRLASRTDMTTGVRTLATAERNAVDAFPDGKALAEMLSSAGKRVLLVIWSLAGRPAPIARSVIKRPGLNDLLIGSAGFEAIIGRIPGSDVHIVQPGSAPQDKAALIDPDRLNLVFDALDEAYDQIVVVARHDDARQLFEALEGRFDAAVLVAAASSASHPGDGEDMLLGFEVADIDIVRLPQVGDAPATGGSGRRVSPGQRAEPVA